MPLLSYFAYQRSSLRSLTIIIYMMSKTFRVRYWLQSLETRSSPLFSTVRAYLINESLKRLIAESTPIKNGKLHFQAQLEEEARSIPVDSRGVYAEAKATIMLEFGAQGRFIKMGEVQVNLSDILHHGKNGEVLPYRVEKCYDRNAKINLGVTITEVGKADRSEVEMHSRSQSQFPAPRVKIRTASNKNKVIMATEYEQFTDREQKQEDLSMISDRHHSIVRTLNRTELLRNSNPQSQEVLDLKTENRIYQHQIVQLEQNLKEAEEQMEELRMERQGYRGQISKLETGFEEVNNQLKERQQSKEIQREQLTTEVVRIRKLYQESEQERNKLLLLREEETSKEKERLKEHERRAMEDRNRVRQLERNQELLKKKIEQCMQQIAMYDKTLKTQQKVKEKINQALNQQQKSHISVISELQIAKQTCLRLSQSNSELQSELQISRFSLSELQKELTLIRRAHKETQAKLLHCQAELRASSQTIQTQRSNFTRKIHEIQAQTDRDQRGMEAYLQELQIKTSKEENKNGLINTLRREVSRLKQQLASERERTEEMEFELQSLTSSGKLMEGRIQEYQAKIMNLSRENALMQSQIASKRQIEQQTPRLSEQCGISEKERQEIVAQCYQERDQVWRKELDSLENDTRALIEKTKREKDEYIRQAKRLKEDLHTCEESLKKSKIKVKDLLQEEEKLKRTIKQLEGRCHQYQKNSNESRMECNRYEQKMIQLQKKLQYIPELQETLRQAQKKIVTIKHEADQLRSDLEKQKVSRTKLRSDVKEMVTTAATYLGKSQKHRVFYDELHCEHIDAQLLLVFNSSCKLYCDRHNRLRGKLEQLEDLRGQLESKQRECEKINSSIRDERRSQGGSCDSASSANNRSQSQATHRQLHTLVLPKTVQKDDLELRTLKRELDQLKNKSRKDGIHNSELQRQVEKTKRSLEEAIEDLRRAREQADVRSEEIAQVRERLKVKERQLETAHDELKGLTNEINYLKNDLQEATRALKQEKGQNLKRSVVNRSFTASRTDRQDDSLKVYELEKKLRQTQEDLERLKRQKDDRKNENSNLRLAKGFEARLKEKDLAIAAIKQNLEQQREKLEQAKQLYNLKLRKQKQEYEEELQSKTKSQKQLGQNLNDCEQKLRQTQKKLKVTEQALRNASNQLQTSAQRQEKTKKLIAAEWELKLKASQGEFQTQISQLNKRIDELRVAQRVAKESQRRKEKQLTDVRQEVERGERTVAELTERLELCGLRLKNLEDEESNYKEVIGALESKIKVESEESRREREADRDTLDNHSNFSIKTFTFR